MPSLARVRGHSNRRRGSRCLAECGGTVEYKSLACRMLGSTGTTGTMTTAAAVSTEAHAACVRPALAPPSRSPRATPQEAPRPNSAAMSHAHRGGSHALFAHSSRASSGINRGACSSLTDASRSSRPGPPRAAARGRLINQRGVSANPRCVVASVFRRGTGRLRRERRQGRTASRRPSPVPCREAARRLGDHPQHSLHPPHMLTPP